ncbi:MAG: transglycosylase domain-containing protein [Candidatus Woesearchaeota archaeon]
MFIKILKKIKNIFFFLIKVGVVFFLLGLLFSFSLFVYYAKDLPRPEKFTEQTSDQSTKIYDRNEKVLYEIAGEEERTIVPSSEISTNMKNAVIAAEDSNFYNHYGIDHQGITRAIIKNIEEKKLLYGGSTIPQQLIRSVYFSTEKTIERKVKEIILTLELDRRHSKEQILEWYLNQIPLGSSLYGVEAASKSYFNKSASDLDIKEAATLAAMIKAPSYYSNNREMLKFRRNYIIDRMYQEHFINEKEAEKAKKEKLNFEPLKNNIIAPHFVLYVRDYLESKYGKEFIRKKGLKVYTTLDYDLQKEAKKAIEDQNKKNEELGAYNAALISIDPNNGEILTMVGSKGYFKDSYPEDCVSNCLFDPQVNITTKHSGRQTGSAFKPFIYATAFSKGYSPNETVIDEETNFGIYGGKSYIPENYDGKFRGEISLRDALAQSINIPAVKALNQMAGIEDTIKTAQKMGITTLNKDLKHYGLSLALGSAEIKLIDITSAFGVFATEGERVSPTPISKIVTNDGEVLEKNHPTLRRVLKKETAIKINSVLSDNEARAPMFGENSDLHIEEFDAAAKTGTTNDYKDAWTIGYNPNLVTGVWVGNNNNKKMSQKPSINFAGPIWNQFMKKALSSKIEPGSFTPLNK